MNIKALFFDIRRLLRDPVLRMFLLVPFITLVVVKLFLTLGEPILLEHMGFTLVPYYGYIVAVCLTFSPYMLGTVIAFLMIDERDENIYELISITPMGYMGYIINRLFVPFVLCIPYTIMSYFVLTIVPLSFAQGTMIALLSGIQSIVVSLMMFSLADNKVQGLTYSKGLNIFVFAAVADLLNLNWVSNLSAFIPFYWTSQMVRNPIDYKSMSLAIIVHLVWLYIAIHLVRVRR